MDLTNLTQPRKGLYGLMGLAELGDLGILGDPKYLNNANSAGLQIFLSLHAIVPSSYGNLEDKKKKSRGP